MIAISPAVICSPDETTASYSRASWSGFASRVQRDELVRMSCHGGDHDDDAIACLGLALHVERRIS